MKRYIKEIDGKKIIKTANQIIIVKNDMQTLNPSEDMILADGWAEYVEPSFEYLDALSIRFNMICWNLSVSTKILGRFLS